MPENKQPPSRGARSHALAGYLRHLRHRIYGLPGANRRVKTFHRRIVLPSANVQEAMQCRSPEVRSRMCHVWQGFPPCEKSQATPLSGPKGSSPAKGVNAATYVQLPIEYTPCVDTSFLTPKRSHAPHA